MPNIITLNLTDIKRDTIATLNANFQALNTALSIANRYAVTLTGAAGEVTVTHGLGTRDVVVQCWNQLGVMELVQVAVVDVNTVKLWFNLAFSGRVVIL